VRIGSRDSPVCTPRMSMMRPLCSIAILWRFYEGKYNICANLVYFFSCLHNGLLSVPHSADCCFCLFSRCDSLQCHITQLAMKQTTMVLEQLAKVFPDRKFEIVSLKTLGDKVLDVSLSKVRSLAMCFFC
jgi:hypothetical protein